MNSKLNKSQIERFSRQIILKNIGSLGQKKIIQSKVLIIGMGGLGCPVAEFLTRAGVGYLGIIDSDKVDLSNIHRQSLYNIDDLNKFKVITAKEKLKKINPKTQISCYKIRLNKNNYQKIIKKYDYVIDGSDERSNYRSFPSLLINKLCQTLLYNQIKDYTSCIILFKKKILLEVFPKNTHYANFIIDFIFELLKNNKNVVEVAFTQDKYTEENSKSAPNIIRFFFNGIFYLFSILRFNLLRIFITFFLNRK